MYQNLQNEYDKLFQEHEELLNIVNNKQYTNDHTTYGEMSEKTGDLIHEMLQSLHHDNNNRDKFQSETNNKQETDDQDMTVMTDDDVLSLLRIMIMKKLEKLKNFLTKLQILKLKMKLWMKWKIMMILKGRLKMNIF